MESQEDLPPPTSDAPILDDDVKPLVDEKPDQVEKNQDSGPASLESRGDTPAGPADNLIDAPAPEVTPIPAEVVEEPIEVVEEPCVVQSVIRCGEDDSSLPPIYAKPDEEPTAEPASSPSPAPTPAQDDDEKEKEERDNEPRPEDGVEALVDAASSVIDNVTTSQDQIGEPEFKVESNQDLLISDGKDEANNIGEQPVIQPEREASPVVEQVESTQQPELETAKSPDPVSIEPAKEEEQIVEPEIEKAEQVVETEAEKVEPVVEATPEPIPEPVVEKIEPSPEPTPEPAARKLL